MKIIFILLLLFSYTTKAQINRSAKELASENIKEYLNQKIFKDHFYKPVSNSDLKHCKHADPDILWSIDQKVESIENLKDEKQFVPVRTTFKFRFYLNKRMEVVTAESINF